MSAWWSGVAGAIWGTTTPYVLTAQTDARGCVTALTYDALNRLTGKSYSGCPASVAITLSVAYTYDNIANGNKGIGRRTGMITGTGDANRRAWVYDLRGRVTSETTWLDSNPKTTQWTYNSAELPVTMTYPDGEVVTTAYLPQMAVNSLSGAGNYVTSTGYDIAGRVKTRALGSGNTTTYTYNAWNTVAGGALSDMATTGGLQDMHYNYNVMGGISQITDSYNNGQINDTLNYTYDALNRLTAVSGAVSESYAYDALKGNLQSKGGQALTYTDAAHVHAATTLGSTEYSYDANGNQITRVKNVPDPLIPDKWISISYELTYDAENRLTGVTWTGNHSAAFTYDADGKRVKGVVDGTATYYYGAHYEVQGSVVTKYYFAGGTRVAMRVGGTLTYLFADHLGSTTVSLTGGTATYQRYMPWGEVRGSTNALPTTNTYTGQKTEQDIGLMYYNARYYDPALGRFAQADTIIPEPGSPRGWDRYVYVNNSPVNFNDPSGHVLKDDNLGGLDPLTPTWFVDNYGESAETINRIDIWYSTHQDYNLYADINVWATNYGELTVRNEYRQIVQSYGAWKVLNSQQDLLITQMRNQQRDFIQGNFKPTVSYYEKEDTKSDVSGESSGINVGSYWFFMGVIFPNAASGAKGCFQSPYGYPSNPANPPAPEFQWMGGGKPGTNLGNWYNPNTGEWLHYDSTHHGVPHYDYRAADKARYWIWPDGSMDPKD